MERMVSTASNHATVRTAHLARQIMDYATAQEAGWVHDVPMVMDFFVFNIYINPLKGTGYYLNYLFLSKFCIRIFG